MKYFLLLFLSTLCFSTFSQSENVYAKVNEVFGENYAEELATTNPGKLALLTKYAETGFIVLNGNIKTKNVIEINEIPLREKGKSLPINEFVYILQNEVYNPLTFEWIPGIYPKVYKLGSTNYFICVPSSNN